MLTAMMLKKLSLISGVESVREKWGTKLETVVEDGVGGDETPAEEGGLEDGDSPREGKRKTQETLEFSKCKIMDIRCYPFQIIVFTNDKQINTIVKVWEGRSPFKGNTIIIDVRANIDDFNCNITRNKIKYPRVLFRK